MSDRPTPELAAQDRRAKVDVPLAPDKAPAGLQAAIRQLDGISWEKVGSGAEVHRSIGPAVYFNEDILFRLEIHQGNPGAIAELIEEVRRAKIPQRKRTASRKPGYGAKRFR
jgi:hypothetical protein